MGKPSLADIASLSVEERIVLVEALWDSIAELPEAVALTEPQKRELDRRLEEYQKNPGNSSPWAEVKARITGAQ